jgi:PhnB protein
MSPAVPQIPEGYHTLTPYLCCKNAKEAMEFYKKAFGAEQLFMMPQPDGRVGHAEMKIGTSRFMLADEYPEMGFRSPASIGGAGLQLHMYVEDVDAAFDRAVKAGAQVVRPVADQFYGDRSGTLSDPSGHVWHISTHKEDLSFEEIERRARAHHAKTSG